MELIVSSGTSVACIKPVYDGEESLRTNITRMLCVYNGRPRYSNRLIVEEDIYKRWFMSNVIHDVGARMVEVVVDVVQDSMQLLPHGILLEGYRGLQLIWKRR